MSYESTNKYAYKHISIFRWNKYVGNGKKVTGNPNLN